MEVDVVRVLVAALVLALAACGAPPPKAHTPAGSVRAAFERVEAEQSALPPAKDDSERLERMFDLDQAGRAAFDKIDFSVLPEAERAPARYEAWAEVEAQDRANRAAFKAMRPATGWFTKDRYSDKARGAAFLIVQHWSGDPAFKRDALARMEPLVATGDVKGTSFAMLYDRVAMMDGRPQRYGTQMVCRQKRWTLAPLEEPERVDERRKQVGFSDTLADYEARFASMPDCA
jgi:hypothetical protein